MFIAKQIEFNEPDSEKKSQENPTRSSIFQIRLPNVLKKKIVEKKSGPSYKKFSISAWIIEAIAEKLEREEKK